MTATPGPSPIFVSWSMILRSLRRTSDDMPGNSATEARLPTELCYMILDHLLDDLPALRVCSLVCSAWVTLCRSYKLRSVALRTPERFASLQSILESPLTEPSSIPLFARELRVGANPHDTTHDRSDIGALWETAGLVPLLCRFANVGTLQLDNLNWTPRSFPPDTAKQFMSAFPQLRVLTLKVAVFHSPEDLLLLLSSFPRLVSVTMAFVSWFDNTIVALWTTSPHRPPKQSTDPVVLALKTLRTDPTSWIAIITAASVSRRIWRFTLDKLEWVGHEKFTSNWMLARAYEQSTAFINPLSEMTAHLFAVDGHGEHPRLRSSTDNSSCTHAGLLGTQPSLVSRVDALHIDITTMPSPQAWTSVRVIPFSTLNVCEIRYMLGTIHASSIFTELGERLAWMFLDRYLTGLIADHPRLLAQFHLCIDFGSERADYGACMADVESSFSHNLNSLLESGARVCAVVTFPANISRELWWPAASTDSTMVQHPA